VQFENIVKLKLFICSKKSVSLENIAKSKLIVKSRSDCTSVLGVGIRGKSLSQMGLEFRQLKDNPTKLFS